MFNQQQSHAFKLGGQGVHTCTAKSLKEKLILRSMAWVSVLILLFRSFAKPLVLSKSMNHELWFLPTSPVCLPLAHTSNEIVDAKSPCKLQKQDTNGKIYWPCNQGRQAHRWPWLICGLNSGKSGKYCHQIKISTGRRLLWIWSEYFVCDL